MITSKAENSIKRLLLKSAKGIGFDCFKYTSFLLAQKQPLSQIELEILERIFTMGLYSDEIIEGASATAFDQNVHSVVEFNFLISEVSESWIDKAID
jgi:hypothetical protein